MRESLQASSRVPSKLRSQMPFRSSRNGDGEVSTHEEEKSEDEGRLNVAQEAGEEESDGSLSKRMKGRPAL